MNLVTLVLKALDGGVKILERDIENASDKIVALSSRAMKASIAHAAQIDNYHELIEQAHSAHAQYLKAHNIKTQAVIIRRNTATKLKTAIAKLLNGDV